MKEAKKADKKAVKEPEAPKVEAKKAEPKAEAKKPEPKKQKSKEPPKIPVELENILNTKREKHPPQKFTPGPS